MYYIMMLWRSIIMKMYEEQVKGRLVVDEWYVRYLRCNLLKT